MSRRGLRARFAGVTIIHSSPLPDVTIPDVTITAHVLRKVADMPDRVAIRDAAGTSSYTFSELSTAIHSLAGGLAARGITTGSVVSTCGSRPTVSRDQRPSTAFLTTVQNGSFACP